MDKVIIFGTGDISQIANFYLSKDSRYEVVAFTMDSKYVDKQKFENLPIVAFDNIEESYSIEEYKMFVPLSYTNINKLRESKFDEASKKGYKFISYISPNATVAENSNIGANCFIFEDNTIQPYVTIEDNCILWSGNHIGHHSIIRKHCFVSSHVVIAGGCEIEQNSFLGVNATLRDHIKIGKYNVIGAGALILRSTEDDQVYVAKGTELSNRSSHSLSL